MSRIEEMRRSIERISRLLLVGLLFWSLVASARTGPIRVWSIDFNDPREPDRWKLSSYSRDSDPRSGLPSEHIRWRAAPRNASSAAQGAVLEFSANSRLSVETYFSVFRPFPPEFQPEPSSDLVLEWEWRLADTEHSGATGLSILRFEPDGSTPDGCFGVDGFTKFTSGWAVFFDPPGRWLNHRVAMNYHQCGPEDSHPKAAKGIDLMVVSPVRQIVSLASLRVEEWPRGTVIADPVFRPHHAPPPEQQFEPLSVHQLRRSTAGAAEDLDGDGLPELLVLDRRGYTHLYRNTGGTSRFEDISERAGLVQAAMGTGAMFVDLDADGDRDLILTSEFDVPHMFENRGDLRFRERRLLDDRNLSFWYGATAEDVDRDGDPDLLFVSPLERNFLFLRNQGKWRFQVDSLFDPGPLGRLASGNFSSSFADLDDNGWPDLFLGREFLFRNSGGRFEFQMEPWQDPNHAHTEGGVWADLTGDGRLDLLVLRDTTDDVKGSSRFFEGKGGGAFEDITRHSGVPVLESAEVALAEDFDNDGDLDLYLCQRERPNYLLLNDGRGHFSDGTEHSGFSEMGGCDSAVATDLNGDGGLDVVILRYGSAPALLLNQLVRGRWFGLALRGRPGTDAIGARLRLLDSESGQPLAVRWMRRGSGFGSVGPAELRFGLGSRTHADVEVRFPSGVVRRLRAVPAGRTHLIAEGGGGIWHVLECWFLEARNPWVRSFRKASALRAPLAMLIAGLGFLVGLALVWKPFRPVALLVMLGGLLFAGTLGSIPGQGLAGSPLSLWALGVIVGTLVPLGVLGARKAVGSVRNRSRIGSPQLEELIRFTHDFRHSALARKALHSIQIRAINLFSSGKPNPTLLPALRELAGRYPQTTGDRVRGLLTLSDATLPGLAESGRLADSQRALETLLGELARLGDDPDPLRRWQGALVPALTTTRNAMEALVERIDQFCSCDARVVVREVCALQAEHLEYARVALAVDLGDHPARALITREALLLILENLFTNALRALEPKGEGNLEIEIRKSGDHVILQFRDNGPGVPQEHAERIFHFSFSTRPSGKGYGLPRSREILGHFGGGIVLEPNVGKGATFSITLLGVPDLESTGSQLI